MKAILIAGLLASSLTVSATDLRDIIGAGGQNATARIIRNQIEQNGWSERPTDEKNRLMAYSRYEFNEIVDSIRNYYSAGRGSIFENPIENAMAAYPLYLPGSIERQIVQCDSFKNWMKDEGSPDLDYRLLVSYAYDESNLPTRIKIGSDGLQDFTIFYNAEMQIKQWDMSLMGIPSYQVFRTYNLDGLKSVDSTFDLNFGQPSNKVHYAYSTTGLPSLDSAFHWVDAAWTLFSVSEYYYDAEERLVESIYREMDGPGTVPEYVNRETLSYIGATTIPSSHVRYDRVDAAWLAFDKNIVELNTNGDPYINTYYERLGTDTTLSPLEKIVSTYNDKRLITKAETFRYSDGAFLPEPYKIEHLYYELYDDGATTIPGLKAQGDVMTLFPNPADSRINITLESSDLKSVTIFDYTGRIVMEKAANNSNVTVDVSSYPSGNYLVRMATGNGVTVKRFVVRH